ncbi:MULTISPECIES: YaaL family protein [Bacillaceae]|uniref:YaaL family protein n=1 Tax=Bacillaceae TaxID=186817 RepID=UPI001BDF31A2|nr:MULTISPECIES: YaaL family protein [Bacillaceae]MDX8363393.1 YaaL family protein [Cytobacillus sp. IB215316]
MFFLRKGKLRKQYDKSLIKTIEEVKEDWEHHKQIVERSVEPSRELLNDLKIIESTYFFLLREAKNRQVSMAKFT